MLTVDDLRVTLRTRQGAVPALHGVAHDPCGGCGDGAGRGKRMREDAYRARDHAPAARARGDLRRARVARRPRSADPSRSGDGSRARRRDRDDLPAAARLAQSGIPDRVPAHPRAASAPRALGARRAGRGRSAAGPCRPAPARRRDARVSAPPVGGHVPARDDRAGACVPVAGARGGRAHDRARCHGPAADRRSVARVAARARAHHPADHARPRARRGDVRPCQRDVRRSHRRIRTSVPAVSSARRIRTRGG